jgi:hypothetical protein
VSDRLDAEPVVQQIEAWRDAGWIFVALNGETVWKRFTRDTAFTQVKVRFYSNRSPAVPRSRAAFDTVFPLGSWRAGSRAQWGSNAVTVPIADERGPMFTATGQVIGAPSRSVISESVPF